MPRTITIGSKIKISINGRLKQLQIVSSAEIDAKQGKISYLSPIGQATLGHGPGDYLEVILNSGKKLSCQIISLD
jgi:transcription elongation GreA/GreB family factor